jgi:hypothetical protein
MNIVILLLIYKMIIFSRELFNLQGIAANENNKYTRYFKARQWS